MASKKELLQAQTFSRRRLLTAFVSGAPGGRELEPAKPLRGVITSLVLSVLVVGGSLIAGLFTGEQDDDWKINSLVVVEETGARYVAVNGELHPVHNVTSARLLAFADTFRVVNLDESDLEDVPRGAVTVGIPGAPDALPPPKNLINNQWLSCAVGPEAEWTSLRADREAPQGTSAALVRVNDQIHYVHEGYRYALDQDDLTALSHVLEFHPDDAHDVSGRWLNIFTEGTPLTRFSVPDFGSVPPGPAAGLDVDLTVGSVVLLRNAQGQTGAPHVLDDEGELVELTPLAVALYYLGSGLGPDDVITLDYSERQQLRVDPDADLVPSDWPEQIPQVLPGQATPCVHLARGANDDGPAPTAPPEPAEGQEETRLHVVAAEEDVTGGMVEVDAGHGAVVRLDGGGAQGAWIVVDERGTMYHIPPGHREVLDLLGYGDLEPPPVPAAWAGLFLPGPGLTVEAARSGLPAEAISGMDGHVDEPAEEE